MNIDSPMLAGSARFRLVAGVVQAFIAHTIV